MFYQSNTVNNISVKVAPYCFLKSGEKANFILKTYHEYFGN